MFSRLRRIKNKTREVKIQQFQVKIPHNPSLVGSNFIVGLPILRLFSVYTLPTGLFVLFRFLSFLFIYYLFFIILN
jgi:hypothetical protein